MATPKVTITGRGRNPKIKLELPPDTNLLKETKNSYFRLFSFIRPHKKRFALALILAVLAGSTTGAFLLVLQIVTGLVLRGSTGIVKDIPYFGHLDLDKILSPIIPTGTPLSTYTIICLCAIIPLMMLIRGTLDFLATYLTSRVNQDVTFDLRNQLFQKVLARSLSFFNRQRGGDLVQTVYNMTNLSASAALTLAKDIFQRPAAILSAIAVLIFLDPMFMVFSLLFFPICMLPVIIISRRVRRSGQNEQTFGGMILAVMQEAFNGIRVVKSHAREPYEAERFRQSSNQLRTNTLQYTKYMEIVGPMVEVIASFGLGAGLYYCYAKGMHFEDFMTRCLALVAIYPDVKALSKTQVIMQRCVAATTKIFALFDEKPEIDDIDNPVDLDRSRGAIRFDNVTFSYHPKGPAAVRNLSFDLQPGKFYALVGESGAGKSTILSLLLRFYDPESGNIYVDGTNIKNIKQTSLRANIGIVNQDLFLFHDSIMNNILYGRLDATPEEVKNAVRTAHAGRFINQQPQKYQTVVGDKGCNLSGGQQQRITIARAIVRNAPILLLDEATSNLDPETEQAFRDALRSLRKDRTIIAIAHRFSTILEADEILVMDKGTVIERGTHTDLMARSSQYERLYRLQFESAELESTTGKPPTT